MPYRFSQALLLDGFGPLPAGRLDPGPTGSTASQTKTAGRPEVRHDQYLPLRNAVSDRSVERARAGPAGSLMRLQRMHRIHPPAKLRHERRPLLHRCRMEHRPRRHVGRRRSPPRHRLRYDPKLPLSFPRPTKHLLTVHPFPQPASPTAAPSGSSSSAGARPPRRGPRSLPTTAAAARRADTPSGSPRSRPMPTPRPTPTRPRPATWRPRAAANITTTTATRGRRR
jgi:hypothetical protein